MLEKPREEEKEVWQKGDGNQRHQGNHPERGQASSHTMRFNGIYTAREGHFGNANRHKTRTAIKEPVKRRL